MDGSAVWPTASALSSINTCHPSQCAGSGNGSIQFIRLATSLGHRHLDRSEARRRPESSRSNSAPDLSLGRSACHRVCFSAKRGPCSLVRHRSIVISPGQVEPRSAATLEFRGDQPFVVGQPFLAQACLVLGTAAGVGQGFAPVFSAHVIFVFIGLAMIYEESGEQVEGWEAKLLIVGTLIGLFSISLIWKRRKRRVSVSKT